MFDIILEINSENIKTFEDNENLKTINGIAIFRDIRLDLNNDSKFKGYIIIRIYDKDNIDNIIKQFSKILKISIEQLKQKFKI